jgi:hypothetical protein
MDQGPSQIFACPSCERKVAVTMALSENSFGAEHYSDGNSLFPMMLSPVLFHECKLCGHFFLLSEAKRIGSSYDLKGVDRVGGNFEMYKRALASWLNDSADRELNFRMELRWSFNQALEYDESINTLAEKEFQKVNMERLLELLPEDEPENLLLKADIARNLSLFKESKSILRKIKTKDIHLLNVKHQLSKKINQRNSERFRLTTRLNGWQVMMLKLKSELGI